MVDDYKAKQQQITDQEASIKKILDAARVRVGEVLSKDTERYLTASQAVIGGQSPNPETLDQETLTRWTNYLKSTRERTPVPERASDQGRRNSLLSSMD